MKFWWCFATGPARGKSPPSPAASSWSSVQGRDLTLIGMRAYRFRFADKRSVKDVLLELSRRTQVMLAEPHYVFTLSDDTAKPEPGKVEALPVEKSAETSPPSYAGRPAAPARGAQDRDGSRRACGGDQFPDRSGPFRKSKVRLPKTSMPWAAPTRRPTRMARAWPAPSSVIARSRAPRPPRKSWLCGRSAKPTAKQERSGWIFLRALTGRCGRRRR